MGQAGQDSRPQAPAERAGAPEQARQCCAPGTPWRRSAAAPAAAGSSVRYLSAPAEAIRSPEQLSHCPALLLCFTAPENFLYLEHDEGTAYRLDFEVTTASLAPVTS